MNWLNTFLVKKPFDQNLLDTTVRLQRAIMDTDILESIRIRICERKPDSKNNVYYPYIISKEDFLQNKNIIEKTRAADFRLIQDKTAAQPTFSMQEFYQYIDIYEQLEKKTSPRAAELKEITAPQYKKTTI